MSILELPREILLEIFTYNQLPWTSAVCRELYELEKDEYVLSWRREYLDIYQFWCIDECLWKELVNLERFILIDHQKKCTAMRVLLLYVDEEHFDRYKALERLLPYGDDDMILPLLEDPDTDDIELIIKNGWPSLIDEMMNMDIYQCQVTSSIVSILLEACVSEGNDECLTELLDHLDEIERRSKLVRKRSSILDNLLRRATSPTIARILRDRGVSSHIEEDVLYGIRYR